MVNSIKIYDDKLRGRIDISRDNPSKSITHRAIILSALCEQDLSAMLPTKISDDLLATCECTNDILCGKRQLFVRESASTLRFLIPLALFVNGGATFVGSKDLFSRPLDVYKEAFSNVKFDRTAGSLTMFGKIFPGKYHIRGDVSSQFISGLLMTLPLLDFDSEIIITTPLQSAAYVEITVDVMSKFGVSVVKTLNGYYVCGRQNYKPCDNFVLEGDWSYSANYTVANMCGGDVDITGLDCNSLQGDKKILALLNITDIDVSQTPDLFPILAVLACSRVGKTRLHNASRLRIKECDRLNTMATELEKLGAHVEQSAEMLKIDSVGSLSGGVTVNAHGDHRIAMALTIAAAICKKPIILDGFEAVKKSAPCFFEDIKKLGGHYEYLG